MLRWQVMTSLAYGASGYMYFCYWSPGVFALGGGIIVPRGSANTAAGYEMVKGPHYYEAQVRKRISFAPFYTNNDLILPRQAQDKHRESTQKRCVLLQRINSVAKIYGGFLLGRKSLGVFRADSAVSNVTAAVSAGVPYHTENGGSYWGTDKAPVREKRFFCTVLC
jgi:hypothetical protein